MGAYLHLHFAIVHQKQIAGTLVILREERLRIVIREELSNQEKA
jgi:hypothetical protein